MSPRTIQIGEVEVAKSVLVTRAPGSKGIVLEIIAAHPDEAKTFRPPSFQDEREAAEVYEALRELPVETRRALYLLIQEYGDGFCEAPAKTVKATPPLAPSARRRR